jgi:hypothetical protein
MQEKKINHATIECAYNFVNNQTMAWFLHLVMKKTKRSCDDEETLYEWL